MATNTTNYNFKKPDESDFYSIQDQNNNWDKADAALKDLDTPTFEDYSGSMTVPDAATAINSIRSKGKLSTILSNMKAAFKGACLIGQIVNNCVTNNAKLPLSAAQGKALMDLYTQLNSDLANLLDRLSAQRTTVPNRLDREATVIQFYKSNGTVSVQMSFQLAWSISKDVADMICAIPTGFNPSAARWVNSDTSNTGKNIQFNVKQNENGVWCLYLTALDNLTATDRINDSFIYQL